MTLGVLVYTTERKDLAFIGRAEQIWEVTGVQYGDMWDPKAVMEWS